MAKKTITKFLPQGVKIIHEDRDIMVVNKPAGMLTIATKKDNDNNLYFALTDYVRKGNQKSPKRIFIVHRLDRDTSGLVIFAKTKFSQDILIEKWEEVEQNYMTIVHDVPEETSAILKNLITGNKIHHMYITKDVNIGKEAITSYNILKAKKEIALLEVQQLTNRKNQIRVQLAEIGHPIIGDKKYAGDRRKHRELLLHAYKLTFKHPFTGERMVIQSPLPDYFDKLVRGSVKKYSPKKEKSKVEL